MNDIAVNLTAVLFDVGFLLFSCHMVTSPPQFAIGLEDANAVPRYLLVFFQANLLDGLEGFAVAVQNAHVG